MITVTFYRDTGGRVNGFKLENHAKSRVCAAVSALAINAANSVEKFTSSEISLSYDSDGGYMDFKSEMLDAGGELLLKSFELGVTSIAEQYKRQIKIIYE